MKAGAAIEVVKRDEQRVSIADVYELYFGRTIDREFLIRALQAPVLTYESRSTLLSRMGQR